MSDKFSVTITAKARHGKLWELRKKFGSSSALARYLEMGPSELGHWINLRKRPKRMTEKRKNELDKKLAPYGLLVEDLFPVELTDDILDRPKDFEVTREISLALLASGGGVRLIENQEETVEREELKEVVDKTMYSLTPREERVIKLRFGLSGEGEHSLQDVGEILECSSERVRQIEAKALRKLRHPSRSKELRDFVSVDSATCVTLYQTVSYHREKEIVCNFVSENMCDVYDMAVYTTGTMWGILRDNGSYMRIAVNDRIVWMRKILEEEIGYRYSNRYSNTCINVGIAPNIRVCKGNKVSVEIGPIILTKNHKRSLRFDGIVDMQVELGCRSIR